MTRLGNRTVSDDSGGADGMAVGEPDIDTRQLSVLPCIRQGL
jgi:hypothetical protein